MTIDESLLYALHKAGHRSVYTNSYMYKLCKVYIYVLNVYSNDHFLIFFLKQGS